MCVTQINGKSVLIVGASGGLGSAIARQLAAAGARLILSGRDESKLSAIGIPGAVLLPADLHEVDVSRRLVDTAIEHTGALDGLVYAAGVVAFGPATEVADDVVDELLLLNYLAPLRLIRAALPRLPAGGFIVSISAVVAEHPSAGMAAYSASKAAAAAFAKSVRIEARRQQIRVLDVRPPHTETGLAGRPIAGVAPKLGTGLRPDAVAERIVRALVDDEMDLPSTSFSA